MGGHVPLKNITELFERSKRFALYNRWAFEAPYAVKTDYYNGWTEIVHYGEHILWINEKTKEYRIPNTAFSQSDRDTINTMFYIVGINAKAHIIGGEIVVRQS